VTTGSAYRDLALIGVVALASWWVSWIGYQGWGLDDAHYLLAAEHWASEPPYVGGTHWELRLGFVLPLAAAIKLLGYNETALLLAPALFYAALLLVNYFFVSVLVGRIQGLYAAVLTASVPLVSAWATTPRVAIAEAFYLTLAFWCFAIVALKGGRAATWLSASGVCFGLAWLSRESSIGFALAFVVLFLVGRPVRRQHYVWLAGGAALVLVLELGFYAATTGNPFYRLYIDLHHGVITASGGQGDDARAVVARALGEAPRAPLATEVSVVGRRQAHVEAPTAVREDTDEEPADKVLQANEATAGLPTEAGPRETFGRFFDALGRHFDPAKLSGDGSVAPVTVSRLVEPYLLFLIEPYYGLLFWLMLPATVYLAAARSPPRTKALVALLLLFAACSVIGSLYLIYLRPLPRYFLFVAVAAAVVIGMGTGVLWERQRRRGVVALLFGLLFAHAVFMESRRGLGIHNERRLAALSDSIQNPVVTDAETVRMSEFLVRSGELDGALSGCPLPGSVYFFNSERGAHRSALQAVSLGVVLGTTKLIYEYQAREKILGMTLRISGLARQLPDYTVRRLRFPYGISGGFDLGWVDLCAQVSDAKRPAGGGTDR
jgi:4-amino-4-deoxy-L-arabinose transferase-like glycosyltransferase